MKHRTFLHTFVKPKISHNHLVIIPSACSVSKPPLEQYADNKEKQRLKIKALEQHITVTLPFDDNIFCGRWHYFNNDVEYTHSPVTRARMLLEAICAKNKNGYKYQSIYLTDGYGSQEMLMEFKKILPRYKLPHRANSLKTYGFDDAGYIHAFLGTNGICTPIYYSKGLWALLNDISQSSAGTCILKPLNIAAQAVQNLSGRLFPDKTSPDKIRSTTPQQHTNYFIVSELNTPLDTQSCIKWANTIHHSNIVFVLSQDTNPLNTQKLAHHISPNIPIFSGTPVGHGYCLNHGHPVTLFSPATLSTPDNIPVLSWEDTADFATAA